MAEERTLGIARATRTAEDESKDEIQRRMDLARDSISHTVTEIKESVENKVQAVRDSLDWREQFRKRPLAWSAGALGVGFVAGYSIAAALKHDDDSYEDYSPTSTYGYSGSSAQRLTSRAAARPEEPSFSAAEGGDEGPGGLVQRFKETPVYDSLSKEVGSLGSKLVQELSTTAHTVVLPFLLSKFKEMIGLDRLESSSTANQNQSPKPPNWTEPTRNPRPEPTAGHS